MAGVQGEWEVSLNIGGTEVAVNPHRFPEITIRSSIHSTLPSISLQVEDFEGKLLDTLALGDGVPINITMGDGVNGGSYRFLMQGGPVDGRETATGMSFRLNGLLDNMPWMRSVVEGFYEGSSSSVIQQLASKVGLQFEGDSTSDSQVWLPNFMPLNQYAKFVAEHGWASPSSAMMTGVTETGKLLYRDLDKIISQGTDMVFGTGGMPVVDKGITSKAGFYNNLRAYGSNTLIEQMDGTFKELSNVVAGRMSNFMNIGKGVQEALGALGGRVEMLPLGGGNSHEFFEQAVHQNRRIRNLWSANLDVMIPRFSGLEILKKAEFSPQQGGSVASLLNYAGQYVVEAKAMSFKNGVYRERFTLATQGTSGQSDGGWL